MTVKLVEAAGRGTLVPRADGAPIGAGAPVVLESVRPHAIIGLMLMIVVQLAGRRAELDR